MRKKVIIAIMTLALLLTITGCGTEVQEPVKSEKPIFESQLKELPEQGENDPAMILPYKVLSYYDRLDISYFTFTLQSFDDILDLTTLQFKNAMYSIRWHMYYKQWDNIQRYGEENEFRNAYLPDEYMTLKDIQMTDWEVEVSDDEQEATVSVLISQAPLHIKKAYIAMPWWRLGPNKFYFHKVDGEWLIYKHEYPSETGWYFEYSLTELMPQDDESIWKDVKEKWDRSLAH